MYILHLKKIEINDILTKKDDVETSAEMKTIQQIYKANMGLLVGFVLSTVFGFFIYMGEKKIEYKKDFDYFTFMFGKSQCKGESPIVEWSTALKTAFFK
tara:strand:- start:664 stop:960 length:297 start_codon:yes stop_codon:yes gene_type:complete